MFADDFHFGLMQADDLNLIQHEGIDENEKNSIENLLVIGEKHLAYEDHEVENIERGGERNPEFFLQNQGRNIHSAGGRTDPDDNADSCADHQTRKNRAQKHIICDMGQNRESLPEFQRQRIDKGAQQRGEGKAFSEDKDAQEEHGEVEQEDKQGKGNGQIMGHGQREAGGAARDDAARN